MKVIIKLSVAALLAAILAGCISLKPEPRPPYTGVDQVGAIDPGLLIGTWQVINLNPLKDEPPIDAQITFNPDGSMSGLSRLDDEDSSNPFGKMEFEMKGSWSVTDELVTQTISEMEEVSGNPAAKFGIALMSGMMKNKTASSNLYEANANELVFYNEQEGLAQRFTRIE